jgi:proteasome lid subunit RPN8/RPN11
MTARISRAVLDAILARAAADPARECCGLLLGADGRIEAAVPAANVADDPARRFEIDPAALIAAHKAARGGAPGPLGHYHSHPSGDPVPSATDAAQAAPDGRLWLIVTPAGGHALWRAEADGTGATALVAAQLAVTDESGLASPPASGNSARTPPESAE